MKDLTRSEMDEILLAHEKAELEFDIDATMATVVDNPHYELPFMGLVVDGRDAIYAMYKRMIVQGTRDRNLQAVARVVAEARNTLIREAYISFDTPDGKRLTGVYLVVLEFDPETKRIIGERMYADTTYGALMAEIIGNNLKEVPGVSRIVDTAPVINEHDAFAAAAARGIHINNPANKL